ncbi:MAG: hypothetical protein AABX93_02120 [Nanoarchaeota archaeon]
MQKRGLFVILSIIFFAQFAIAASDSASSSSYSIGTLHEGISESNGTSSSYQDSETLTIFGGGNFTSSTYSGDSVWFPVIINQTVVAVETPATTTTPTTSGGGGGSISSIVRQVTDLEVVPDSFGINAVAGRESEIKLSVKNIGSKNLAIETSPHNLDGILNFDVSQFSLPSGEIKILTIKVIAPSEAGIYTGKIILTSEGKRFEIPFVINVNSEFSLFDVSVDIADQYKIIKKGQNVRGQITLVQAGLQEEADVKIEYTIKDFEGNVYSTISETIAVIREKSYEYVFKTSDLPEGDYIIGVEVVYSGGVATASHQFKVTSTLFENTDIVILIIEAIIIISIMIILVIIARGYKTKKRI